jgi:hypothetical protein
MIARKYSRGGQAGERESFGRAPRQQTIIVQRRASDDRSVIRTGRLLVVVRPLRYMRT